MIVRILQRYATAHAIAEQVKLRNAELGNDFVQIAGHLLDRVLPGILRHNTVSRAAVIVGDHRVLLREFFNEAARPDTTASSITHHKHQRIARGRR